MSSSAPRCATATSAGWWFADELMVAMRYVPAGRPPSTVVVRTPFFATSFKPLKNTNLVGSVGVFWSSEVSCSMTTCEWPLMMPASFTTWGAMWNVVVGFVKWPVSRLLIASWIVKSVFAASVPPLAGFWNLAEGILLCAAMTPIGVWLHEPSLICCPFVFCLSGKSRQKLMKLFVDVSDASCPAVGVSWPVCVNVKTLLGSTVSAVWAACAFALAPALAVAPVPVLPLLPVALPAAAGEEDATVSTRPQS